MSALIQTTPTSGRCATVSPWATRGSGSANEARGDEDAGIIAVESPWSHKHSGYSITWSARWSTDGGIVRPSALPVFEVDPELELRELLDGKVSGPGALEDLVHVGRGPPEAVHKARAVADEAAGL